MFDVCIFLTQELMERLKLPSDSQLMQIAINDLNNASLSLEDRRRALQELLILVEPIDNANGMYFTRGIGFANLTCSWSYGMYITRVSVICKCSM